jgi:hypothetical protein
MPPASVYNCRGLEQHDETHDSNPDPVQLARHLILPLITSLLVLWPPGEPLVLPSAGHLHAGASCLRLTDVAIAGTLDPQAWARRAVRPSDFVGLPVGDVLRCSLASAASLGRVSSDMTPSSTWANLMLLQGPARSGAWQLTSSGCSSVDV